MGGGRGGGGEGGSGGGRVVGEGEKHASLSGLKFIHKIIVTQFV